MASHACICETHYQSGKSLGPHVGAHWQRTAYSSVPPPAIPAHCQGGSKSLRRPLVVHSVLQRAPSDTGALSRRQVSETPIGRPLVVHSVLQRAPNLRRSASTAGRRAAHGGRLTAASALCQKMLKALAGHPHRSATASWCKGDMLTHIWRAPAASLLALGRVQASVAFPALSQ